MNLRFSGFMKNLIKDTDELQKNFSKDQEYTFTIKEGLCPGFSKTSYEIVHYVPIKD